MGFEYLTNIPLEKAQEEYLALLKQNGFAPKTEMIPVFEACGRITAKPVYAHICAPHYAASAMDGIAVNARDTFGATETTPLILNTNQYVVVDT
ncbi:MAG: molybdopterin biosynthesis protein, partial [Peptococcaceae bacterium]|nr:molybdopterin biosynthesis protein [Peptococcaceae bacterium]